MTTDSTKGPDRFVSVAIHTTSGSYPPEGYERENAKHNVENVIKKANKKLKITDTTGWLALIEDRRLNIEASYADQDLSGQIDINWGPEEGGGGDA